MRTVRDGLVRRFVGVVGGAKKIRRNGDCRGEERSISGSTGEAKSATTRAVA